MQLFEAQLERLKKASGVDTDTAFSFFLDMSQGSISGAKKKKKIPHSWFFQVAEKTGVSTDWLFFGRGPMYPALEEIPAQRAEPAMSVIQEISAQQAACPRCAKLEAKLEKIEVQRDELVAENRQLLRENGNLRAMVARWEGERKGARSSGETPSAEDELSLFDEKQTIRSSSSLPHLPR